MIYGSKTTCTLRQIEDIRNILSWLLSIFLQGVVLEEINEISLSRLQHDICSQVVHSELLHDLKKVYLFRELAHSVLIELIM